MSKEINDVVATELYRAAVDSAHYEGNLIWVVFSAMTVANGILLGIVGALWPSDTSLLDCPTTILIMVASTLGVAICRRWYWAMRRMFGFYRYWWAWAQEYESRIDPSAQGVTRSLKVFIEGGFPEIATEPVDKHGVKNGPLGQCERNHRNGDFVSYVPIWFASAHGVVLVVAALTRLL